MITLKPSSLPVAGATGPAPLNIHARLAAATEALLKTREQVVEALDHHLSELDTLRRALGNSDKPLLSMVPPVATAPFPAAPQAMPVAPKGFETPPHPSAPMMPMMTQVLWPAKSEAPSPGPIRPAAPPSAPFGGSPISSPMVAFPSTQIAAARDLLVDPDLEKATLEELNAALAYAFNHVSKGRESSPAVAAGSPWLRPGSTGLGGQPL